MKTFWDERFAAKEYIYGEEPNKYFAKKIKQLQPGRLLLPMEGEGRNAVFAASLGWEVDAFDSSVEAIGKAQALAAAQGVELNYKHCRVEDYDWTVEKYDLIALIFAHLPPAERMNMHKSVSNSLRPGGTLILELFHPDQLGRTSGGPKVQEMLYSPDLLKDDFPGIEYSALNRVETTLSEGSYHQGKAILTRGIGTKIKR